MTREEQLERLKELTIKLNKYTESYDAGVPEISDRDWDEMYWELVDLEEQTHFYFSNSPAHKIHYEAKNELTKVTHNHLMLSADKTKDWDTFRNYFNGHDAVCMLKLDGLTCSLRYIDGKLISAETRGNGEIGEDVTHNAMIISSIPKYISYKNELIIDGEIICTENNFEPFKETYKNPRNFASGSIRLLDSAECAKRNLTFVAWNVIKGFNNEDRFNERMQRISKLGFEIVPMTISMNSIAFDEDSKLWLIDKAKEYGYPIDGLVGRFDEILYGESLGATEHHTKAIYAFKFYDEEYETTLINIELSLGRTGQLTPVAIYEDIDTGSATLNKASLHNISVMTDTLGRYPFVGQKIKVFQANEIIPQISWAEDSENLDIRKDKKLIKCTCCPVCGGDIEIEDNEGIVTAWCANLQCQGKLQMRIDHYCSKKGLDIHGISEQTINKLMDKGWLNSISDLYLLSTHKSEWEKLDGFGKASVSKILNAIEQSKNCKVENFIAALGIPLIGLTVAKKLVKIFPTYKELRDFIDTDDTYFDEFDGFGEEMNNALKNFDYSEADKIAEMLAFEQPDTSVRESSTGAAADKVFVITGKLSKARSLIQADIEAAGAKVGSSVTSKTNYLVANAPENTAKYNKALSLGLPIINENELYSLLKS